MYYQTIKNHYSPEEDCQLFRMDDTNKQTEVTNHQNNNETTADVFDWSMAVTVTPDSNSDSNSIGNSNSNRHSNSRSKSNITLH